MTRRGYRALYAAQTASAAAPTPAADGSRPSGRFIALTAFVLLAAALAVFANALGNPFLWDDQYLILDNHLIKDWRYLPELFRHQLYYSTAGLSNFYRPLQSLLLMVEYPAWKLTPFGYHLTSVLVHALCGLAAFLALAELTGRRWVAAAVALLFVVHPVNSTVADYISSRADAQAALGMLLSVWLLWRSSPTDGRFRKLLYLGSLAAFTCALLSKELGMGLPVLAVALAWALGRRDIMRRTLPFWAVLGVYAALRLTVLKFSGPGSAPPPDLGIRLLTSAEAFVRLIGELCVPVQIHVEKSIPFSRGLTQASTLLSLGILGVIAASVLWLGRRSLSYRLGWIWFTAGMLPMAGFVPLNATIADHWLYLPGVGVLLAVIGGASDAVARLAPAVQRPARMAAVGVYVAVAAVFSVMTVRQNVLWGDPERFFRAALVTNPVSFRAHNELGALYLQQERYAPAAAEFLAAIKRNPRFDQAYDNLGVAYDHLQRYDEAIAAHRQALAINPNNPKTHNNLGNAYFKSKRWDEAVAAYEAALRLNPGFKAVYNNLGAVHYQRGDLARARRAWQEALRIDPSLESTANNLRLLDARQAAQGAVDKSPPQP